jgi:hypothetical protein
MDTRLFPLMLAKRFGAKVLSVEHRFFGERFVFSVFEVISEGFLQPTFQRPCS